MQTIFYKCPDELRVLGDNDNFNKVQGNYLPMFF